MYSNARMGKEQVRTGKKHEKKNVSNGVGGFAVGCGALAVAGFIAVASFATKKNKKKRVQMQPNNPKHQPQQNSLYKTQEDLEIEITKRLPSHVERSTNYPTNDVDSPSQETTNMKSINEPSIPEEKIDPVSDHNTNNTYEVVCPTCFHRQEILLSDDFPPESAASSNEEEYFNSHGSQTLDLEPQESRKSLETETRDDVDVDVTPEPEEATSAEKGNINFPVVVSDHQPWASQSVKLKTWLIPMLVLALLLPLLPLIHCACRLLKHFLERVYGDRRTGPRVP